MPCSDIRLVGLLQPRSYHCVLPVDFADSLPRACICGVEALNENSLRQTDPSRGPKETVGEPAMVAAAILKLKPERLLGRKEPGSCKAGLAREQEMLQGRFIGIDVSKARLDVAFRPAE